MVLALPLIAKSACCLGKNVCVVGVVKRQATPLDDSSPRRCPPITSSHVKDWQAMYYTTGITVEPYKASDNARMPSRSPPQEPSDDAAYSASRDRHLPTAIATITATSPKPTRLPISTRHRRCCRRCRRCRYRRRCRNSQPTTRTFCSFLARF